MLIEEFGVMKCPHYHLVPKQFDENVAFRQKMLSMAMKSASARVLLRRMCAEDILFYFNVFNFTYDPRQKIRVLPFITYPEFQDEAILSMADAIITGEDVSVPKSRCMGASWAGLAVFEWFWHFEKMMSFLLISRNEKYVDDSGNPKSLFWKIDFLHEHQPRWLLPTGRHLLQKDPNRKQLHLANADNGSVIDGESTTGDAGRGDRRSAMFLDEHAAFENNDGFRVLKATRDTTKCRIFNSTPQGAANAFYEVVHNTAAREIRMHWASHPEYNKGLYTSKDGLLQRLDKWTGRAELSEKGQKTKAVYSYPEDYPFILDGKMRSPWYDNECARCVSEMEVAQELDIDFLGSDYQFFDPVTIDVLIKKYCRPEQLRGDLEYDPITLEPLRFHENEKGKLLLWIQLDRDGKIRHDTRYVLGSDVSAGTGASNSVTSIVDRTTGTKVGVWRDSKTRPKEFADTSMALSKFFGNGHLIWDASGPTGKGFTMQVINRGYNNIYYRRDEDKIGQKQTDKPGYFLQPEAKAALLEEYRAALGAHTFINPSLQGMKESMQFVVRSGGLVEHNKSATSQDPSGARTAHGDEVIADALANKGLVERATAPETEERPIVPGTLAYRKMLKEAEQRGSNKELDERW